MRARNIKDLSIALEALTRIHGMEDYIERLKDMLAREIDLHNDVLREQETKPVPTRVQPTHNELPF